MSVPDARTLVSRLRHALWDPDAAAAQKKEPTALLQTKVLMAAAFVFGVMVFALLKSGYAVTRSPPLGFYLPCGVVFSLGAVTVYGDALWRELRRIWEGVTTSEEPDGDDPVSQRPTSVQDGAYAKGLWLRNRPNVQPLLVYLLTAIIVVGFVELVWDTGLAIESPYVAFVTAPAVFGPFVARRGGTVAALVLVAVALLVAMTWLFPMAPCHGCANLTDLRSMTGNTLEARVLSWERHRPSPEVYLVSGLAVLALAGTISAQRMRREGKLVRENRDLKRQLLDLGHPAPASDVIDEPKPGDERT
ncbi:MAG TPA: hypothetical protein VHX66_04080 [Solirubrobacteraceae bacterium]|jgi:hypothetical protein|nr:hypothetical protein [Solirubrobacteraceae bacterium]